MKVLQVTKKKLILFSLIYSFSWLIFLFFPNAISFNNLSIINKFLNRFFTIFFLLGWTIVIHYIYSKADFSKIKTDILLYTIILATITPLILLPINSTDIYSYITRGRILSVFNQNPYQVNYAEIQDINFQPLKNLWSYKKPAYSPLFIIISSGLSYLSRNSVLKSIYTFKIFFYIIYFLSSYLVYKVIKNKKTLFLFAFHPLIIFESINNGHITILVLLFLLSSVYFLQKRGFLYESLSLLFLLFSVFIKYIPIIFVPLYFIYIHKRSSLRNVLSQLAIFTTFLFTFYIVFIHPFGGFANIFIGVIEVVNFQFAPILATFPSLIKKITLIFTANTFFIKVSSYLVFLTVYVPLLIYFYTKKQVANISSLLLTMTITYLAMLLFAINWLYSWYYLIPLTLCILQMDQTHTRVRISKLYKFINAMMFIGLLPLLGSNNV